MQAMWIYDSQEKSLQEYSEMLGDLRNFSMKHNVVVITASQYPKRLTLMMLS